MATEITRSLPFYDLRDWWLSHERVAELLNYNGGFKPFFPAAQMPESGVPYIRYVTRRSVDVERWWIHQENIGMDIYMVDIEDAQELSSILVDLSSQGDIVAWELNRWVAEQAEEDPDDEDYVPRKLNYLYHSVQFLGGGDIEPSREEGGAVPLAMAFRIDYSPTSGKLLR